jgi:hypothetical protein
MHGDLQVVWVDRDRIEQLFDEHSSLVVGSGFPDALEVELLEGGEHVLESSPEFFLRRAAVLQVGLFCSHSGDLTSEVLFLGCEEVAGDLVVVVELEQLPSSLGQIHECLYDALWRS